MIKKPWNDTALVSPPDELVVETKIDDAAAKPSDYILQDSKGVCTCHLAITLEESQSFVRVIMGEGYNILSIGKQPHASRDDLFHFKYTFSKDES